NAFLRHIRRPIIGRPTNELDPERLRLFGDDPGRLAKRFILQKSRARCSIEGCAFGRSPGDNRSNAAPVSRRPRAVGLAFPTACFRIGLGAKLADGRAGDGMYSFNPFQMPKQPCKHFRPLSLNAGAWRAVHVLAKSASLTQRMALSSTSRVDRKLTRAKTTARE